MSLKLKALKNSDTVVLDTRDLSVSRVHLKNSDIHLKVFLDIFVYFQYTEIFKIV